MSMMVAVLLIGDFKPVQYFQNLQDIQLNVHRAIGIYLNALATPGQVVAAEDIGYIGFYSKRTILDRDGLISPQVIPYNEKGEYEQVVLDFHPDWVVAAKSSPISGFVSDSSFLAQYAEDTAFVADDHEYFLFIQKTDEPQKVEQQLDKSGS